MMIVINFFFHYYTNLGNEGLAIGYFLTYLINNGIYYYLYQKDEEVFWNVEIHAMSHH